jgi:hypothetical protein
MSRAAATRGERGRAEYHDDRAAEGTRHAQVLRQMLEHAATGPPLGAAAAAEGSS